jgi:hypothetical protein
VQDQEEFIKEQEESLLEEQKGRLGNAAESDQELREAAGRLEIKGVMLRAMSLEVDRFESIVIKLFFHAILNAACNSIMPV